MSKSSKKINASGMSDKTGCRRVVVCVSVCRCSDWPVMAFYSYVHDGLIVRDVESVFIFIEEVT